MRDRYEILETLGSGGEARVVKALDHQHQRLVALKIRPVGSDPGREALLQEARILLGLPPHEALPLVREDFFEGAEYVVAMDWVDGTDLATLLRDRGSPGLASSSALAYLAEAAEALTFLHSQEPPVIHGDVKPANLILTNGGHVKLVDFGLSSTLGMEGQRAGTVGYRAPELAAGEAPSRASDIYALAATAFALLTGAPPAGKLPSWDGFDRLQAEHLERALREGLATDPARRPSTPGEFVERLRAGWGATLPTGVVTFCMSDIAGSTSLWDRNPRAMAEALVRHDELIAEAVESHGGRFLKSMGEGDSTVSVFEAAAPAVQAALAANRALMAEAWPDGLAIEVRWGLNTGEAERRGSDYFGPTVNAAARVRSEANPGEVLLSAATASLVEHQLPDGYSLVDLGTHTLKGLQTPERLHALAGPDAVAPSAATECPYRGLLAFEAQDRRFFFGREDVVRSVLDHLAPGRLLALVGASGSGKSSVLRAGVVAAVDAGEVEGLSRAELYTPGEHPAALARDDASVLQIVDQFEELYTLCHDSSARERFIDDLLAAAGPVVVAVRADFYGELSSHAALARAAAENHILLGAMREEELRRAISEPARLAGLRLEPGLVDLVLRDVAGEPGALPLLSHALRATWERRNGRTLTVQAYRETGGVSSAVAQTADAVASAFPAQQRGLMKSVFLRLTELGDGLEDTRRRVPIDELVPEGARASEITTMLDRLAEARLITLDEDTAEVSHEILIRQWPTLRRWLEEDREGLRIHRRLGDAARLWDNAGRHPTDLYRGTRLDAAAEWASGHRGSLNETERAFLDASLAEAARERQTQLTVNRRLRRLVAGIGGLLLIAAALTALALVARHDTGQERTLARARALALASQQQLSSDPVRALLLARMAEKTADIAPARLSLRQALDADHLLAVLPIRHRRPCNGSDEMLRLPAGARVAKTTCDGRLVVEDVRARRVQRSIRVGGYGHGLAISPDGRTLAVAVDQSVALVRTASWRVVSRLKLPVPPFRLDWDPTSKRLAFATPLGGIGVIDLRSRRVRMIDHQPGWRDVRFLSPQDLVFGRAWRLADGTGDASGGLFAYRIGETGLRPLIAARAGTLPYVGALALLDGRRRVLAAGELISGSGARSAAIWVVDPRTGEVRTRRTGQPGLPFFYSATTLDGGSRAAAGDTEGHTFVVDLRDRGDILELGGANGYVSGLAQTNRRQLAVSSSDGATRLYTLAVPEQMHARVPGATGVYAQRGHLVLPGSPVRTVSVPSGHVEVLRRLPTGDMTDEAGTSFLRPRRDGRIDVLDTRGRVLCNCRYGTPAATQFIPLRSHRAGVLVTAPPYLTIKDMSVEDYRTHRRLRLARSPLSCTPTQFVTTPESRHLLVADQCGHGAIWDLRSGAATRRFTVTSAFITTAAGISGSRFAIGDSRGTTYLYDAHGRQLSALVDASTRVRGLAASPGGDRLASVSEDGILRIWDGRNGDLMRRIDTGAGARSVAFGPEGSAVYTVADRGVVQGFDACPLCGDGAALLRASAPLAVRELTREEKEAFGAQ